MRPEYQKLADVLVGYSTKLQPGERVLIEATDIPAEFVCTLVERVHQAGAYPYVTLMDSRVKAALKSVADAPWLGFAAEHDVAFMKGMAAYIGIRGTNNSFEEAGVPSEKMQLWQKLYGEPVNKIRIPHTRWVVLRWPTSAFAQAAGMTTPDFEKFYFDVCTMDYAKMAAAMEVLKARMERTDRVRIVGPGTDLSFSIKGIPAIPCAGGLNIPDGEIFTAPVRDSVNGTLRFNVPQPYQGFSFTDINLRFEQGKIVEATSNDTARINAILDTDPGARYIGEFALGLHPLITRPMNDTLFDEKIAGSFHFTPGACYDEADNGNHSAIHWDMVMLQDVANGGGEIWFDDELVRRDGRFLPAELQCCNPEALS